MDHLLEDGCEGFDNFLLDFCWHPVPDFNWFSGHNPSHSFAAAKNSLIDVKLSFVPTVGGLMPESVVA
ncbi:MAG TPA: hypothetical protein VE944_20410 [Nostoc sp.]|uniref:hypothetical protein n=1 Tax=Nostoc sp. TaxID=1180 RepID=UPI002D648E1D|nr:hypothetical protein [Nostoc sp.]HYX16686.1 hypothetical protein [Nostoc sp.]